METVEVTIKVTSSSLLKYQEVNQKLSNFTGVEIGGNPIKSVLQQDDTNYVNEIKITAQVTL